MDLSKVKLIVTDMDGTLLNSEHNVSNLFFEQFEILKAKNIKFVAASGRQYHSILDKLKSIKEHITIVAENGAYVMANEQELYVNAIAHNDVLKLINISKKIPNTHIILCGKKKAYFLKDSGEFKDIVTEYYSEYELIDSFDTLPNDDFFKMHNSKQGGGAVGSLTENLVTRTDLYLQPLILALIPFMQPHLYSDFEQQ